MTTSQQPDDQTVRLGSPPPPPPEDTTIRLDPRVAIANATVRSGSQDAVDGTVRLGSQNAMDGTVRLGSQNAVDSTVRLGSQNAMDGTVRLGSQNAVDSTVRLGSQNAMDGTVRLGAKTGDADATVRLPGSAGPAKAIDDSATVLDPEVWPTVPAAAAPPAPAAPAEDGLRRFGPGVPPLAAATWHGTAAPEPPAPPRRRRRGWLLLPLVLLLAVLGYLTWPWFGNQVAVSGATVRTDSAGPSCDGTAVITGTLETNGGAGTVTYHWIRSDGTDSGTLTQQVSAGQRSTDVVLRWTFQGHGTMEATATLQVLTPDQHSASVSFPYNCP